MCVTYCIGSVGAKRRAFAKTEAGNVTADNDDVLLCFTLGGKAYCAQGAIPFGELTVRDYVAYHRALRHDHPLSDREIRFLLRLAACRLPLYRRVRTLSRVQFRHLQLCARLEPETTSVRLNFDGLNFTLRHKRQLNALLTALSKRYRVAVAVTDSRFIPPLGYTVRIDETGNRPVRESCGRMRPAPRSVLRALLKKNVPLYKRNVKKLYLLG